MSDGDLVKWIRYLHAAAAVPKGDPDYDEAQAAVAHAKRKIAFLNRSANRREVATPDERETFRMSAVENTAGDVADVATSALTSLPEVGPLLEGVNTLTGFRDKARQLAGFFALLAKDTDLDAYERGKEAHPAAAAAGELTGPALLALLGGLGRRGLARGLSERVKPLPPEPPYRPRGFVPNEGNVTGGAPSPALRPLPPVPRDPLDVPTFKRRRAKLEGPTAEELTNWLYVMRGRVP